MPAHVAMILAAGLDVAQEPAARERDAVGHHVALGDGRAEPPRGAQQHLSLGGLAQAAAGGLGGNQRLDQHRHGGAGRMEAVVLHVAARVGGPQRRPARPHRGEEIRFVVDAEEALELAGEIRAGTVLDQRGRPHRAQRRLLALRAPGRHERLEDLRRDRLLVELEADLDRAAALVRQACIRISLQAPHRCRGARIAGDRQRPTGRTRRASAARRAPGPRDSPPSGRRDRNRSRRPRSAE